MWINLDDAQLNLAEHALQQHIAYLQTAIDTTTAEAAKEVLVTQKTRYQATLDAIKEKRVDFDPADPYRAAAKEQKQADGELEVDDDAIVSHGEDPGAYVMAWIWITDEQAGRFTCEECSGEFTLDQRYCSVENICNECAAKDDDRCETCGEELDEAGDGWDGKCADCADKEHADGK